MEDEPTELRIWHAGEVAAAGTYMRIDDELYRMVVLRCQGILPPSFDGHIALYQMAAPCLRYLRRPCPTPQREAAQQRT